MASLETKETVVFCVPCRIHLEALAVRVESMELVAVQSLACLAENELGRQQYTAFIMGAQSESTDQYPVITSSSTRRPRWSTGRPIVFCRWRTNAVTSEIR